MAAIWGFPGFASVASRVASQKIFCESRLRVNLFTISMRFKIHGQNFNHTNCLSLEPDKVVIHRLICLHVQYDNTTPHSEREQWTKAVGSCCYSTVLQLLITDIRASWTG